MIRIINGVITEWELPITAKLSSGQTVSNYFALEKDILYREGWYELEEIFPEDKDAAEFDYYEIEENVARVYYKIG